MNWDRWKDASWVRWHKMLPEKQGGWQYQFLAQAGQAQQLVVGSPSLLLHFNGANGSTNIIDSSIVNNTMTAGGSAAITTTSPKFGTGSLNGGGSSSDGVSTPIVAGGPLDLSTGDFTIELWVYPNASHGYGQPLVFAGTSGTGWCIFLSTVSLPMTLNFSFGVSSVFDQASTSPLAVGVWSYITAVRQGNNFGVWKNGVPLGTVTALGGSIGTTALLQVRNATAFGSGFDGGIDELRITKGFAVYTPGVAFTPPVAENTFGTPNNFGSINPPNAFLAATYLGLARDLHDWSSIDGQYWIAIGTHLKLYVVNQATLYDITPTRKTSNVTNALTTTNGSNVVTVTDAGHQAATGDYVTITGAGAVGGLTLAGGYQITVVDPNTYTIVAASNATSSATGGGSFSITYDIGIGLPSNGELLGYGTGPYGLGTYGTPRPVGTGVFARLRTWSLDNYGQDLIASQSDGEIYWWQKNSGPNSRAAIIPLAPQGCQRVLVDAQQRVIIALGCTDVTSAFNAMLVRWCSFDDITDWYPTSVNTAGDDFLTAGSRIITGLKTKGQNLIFTDTTLYRMVFVGAPDIYDFIPAGAVTIVGPNAAVDVDGVAYLMGYDNFYNYSGTLNLQGCDVWETVFDATISTSLLKTQAEKVVCYTYEPKTEVTWLYPSIGGSGENDRYVTFNWEDGSWYYGAWNRTCAMGRAPAMAGYPYGVNAGYLYQHEIGTDAVEAAGTTAVGFYMQSLDITVGGAKSEYTMGGSDARFAIGGSDAHLLLRSILPDWKSFTGSMNLTVFTKDRPQDTAYVQDGPVAFTSTTGQIDIDAHGSQLVIQLDNYTATGGTPSLGSSFRCGILQGLAAPYAKR